MASRPVDKYIFIPTKFDAQLVLQVMDSACKRIPQLVKKIQDSIGKHTLLYTYTALLREDELEITSMGRLDDQTIEVYNNQTWVPKTEWMKNNMPSGYWQRGILTIKDTNSTVLGTLKDICAYEKSADCVLQWRVGCEAEKLANDTLILGKHVEEYHLNGQFTYDSSLRGAAPVQHTRPFGEMFNATKQNLSNFLLKECVDQMRKFIIYNDREPSSPEVIVFSTKKSQMCFRLTCMASGFYPRHIEMSLQMNGVPVTEEGGVRSTGTIPNWDGTFQLRKSLEIADCVLPYDVHYVCVVKHLKTIKTLPIIKLDGMCGFILRIRDGIILASLLLLLLSHAVFYCVMKRKASSGVV